LLTAYWANKDTKEAAADVPAPAAKKRKAAKPRASAGSKRTKANAVKPESTADSGSDDGIEETPDDNGVSAVALKCVRLFCAGPTGAHGRVGTWARRIGKWVAPKQNSRRQLKCCRRIASRRW
jgi:hypothetical protein